MKKYIFLSIVVFVIILSVALILSGIISAGSVSTGTAGTSGTTTGSEADFLDNICDYTGRGHIYVEGICAVCGEYEPTNEEYLKFKLLEDDTYMVYARYIAQAPERLIIPSYYNGKPVTAINKNAFPGYSDIKYIYIPEGVREIGDSAFKSCKNLEEVVLPESLEKIGNSAFSDCDSLKEITVKGDCVTLCDGVFGMCDSLKKAVFECDIMCMERSADDDYLYGIFGDCKVLETVEFRGSIISETEDIGIRMIFSGCEKLKNVTLPKGITYIGASAFYNCKSLESLDIPSSISIIVGTAFSGCEDISLSASDGNEFYDITAHRIIEKSEKALIWQNDDSPIPEDGSVLCIKQFCFEYNNKLTEYKIPSIIQYVESGAFRYCTRLKSVVWESSGTEIPAYAFYECKNLENIDIKSKITEIGQSAFYMCEKLESIEISDTVVQIKNAAFYGCASFESIVIPRGVKTLSGNVLGNCSKLRSIYLPNTITLIENKAVMDCIFLMDIYYDGTIAEWQAIRRINIDGATVVHCTDGDTTLMSENDIAE